MPRHALLPLQLECTLFFQSNPYRTESLEDLAIILKTTKETLLPALTILEEQGIIMNLGDVAGPIYRYKEPAIVTEFTIEETRIKA